MSSTLISSAIILFSSVTIALVASSNLDVHAESVSSFLKKVYVLLDGEHEWNIPSNVVTVDKTS